ncbi:MAG: glycosyltransferase family 4 protein [Planctomycetes bacterium]|nr:glycosyltransferase family 4 protein [Planctomycetota bacterium]
MAERLKVTQVITRLVNGGAQRVVLDLLRRLPKDEFELTLIAGPQAEEGSLWKEAEGLGINLVTIPSLVRELNPLKDFAALRALKRHFQTNQPDVVHAHTSKAGLLACVAARKAKVPKVIYTPHGHIFAKGANIPGVPSRGLKRTLLMKMRKKAHRAADWTIALNTVDQREQVELGLCPASKMRILRNGIDCKRFSPAGLEARAKIRSSLKIAPDAIVVACVARLSFEKGLDILADAWPPFRARMKGKDRECVLLIAGEGGMRAMLEASLPSTKSVRFLGEVKDPERVYRAADLVVVPSRYESQGLVALEAMACGVPVVAAYVGGLAEAVRDGHTGLLCPPEDPKGMAAAMARIAKSRSLLREYGEAGRKQALEFYSLERMVGEHAALYREGLV